jgi:hypothetical protein
METLPTVLPPNRRSNPRISDGLLAAAEAESKVEIEQELGARCRRESGATWIGFGWMWIGSAWANLPVGYGISVRYGYKVTGGVHVLQALSLVASSCAEDIYVARYRWNVGHRSLPNAKKKKHLPVLPVYLPSTESRLTKHYYALFGCAELASELAFRNWEPEFHRLDVLCICL